MKTPPPVVVTAASARYASTALSMVLVASDSPSENDP
jgi:hypothetical protein